MNFQKFVESIDKNKLFSSSRHKIETSNIVIDQSNQSISEESYKNFQKFIDENDFVQRFQKVREGKISNISENKPATHFQYRKEGSNLCIPNAIVPSKGIIFASKSINTLYM